MGLEVLEKELVAHLPVESEKICSVCMTAGRNQESCVSQGVSINLAVHVKVVVVVQVVVEWSSGVSDRKLCPTGLLFW